ncbi:MAG: hypothetical protein GY850_27415 [bacterium]|nr:hypothetical protein [bacterium]
MRLQPIQQLTRVLEGLANDEHYLFTLSDLHNAIPEHSLGAFKTLISRAEKKGLLKRVCRGLYLYPRMHYAGGVLLFHAAARLRADKFNYISLETALSDAGVISQIPVNWLTVLSSGRSNEITCGQWGTIEFVHTRKRPQDVSDQLTYDERCHMWRASVALALKDMKNARRNMDIIDWSIARELV